MQFSEYQAAAIRTAKPDKLSMLLSHCAMGIGSEAGEILTELKRVVHYGAELDEKVIAHLREEMGDLTWYLAVLCEALEIPMNQVARENIAKLFKRFPEKFSEADAMARADKGGADHRSS
jgi:NTP pyrophosphatase (non-canonical NTP hydrolase)